MSHSRGARACPGHESHCSTDIGVIGPGGMMAGWAKAYDGALTTVATRCSGGRRGANDEGEGGVWRRRPRLGRKEGQRRSQGVPGASRTNSHAARGDCEANSGVWLWTSVGPRRVSRTALPARRPGQICLSPRGYVVRDSRMSRWPSSGVSSRAKFSPGVCPTGRRHIRSLFTRCLAHVRLISDVSVLPIATSVRPTRPLPLVLHIVLLVSQ